MAEEAQREKNESKRKLWRTESVAMTPEENISKLTLRDAQRLAGLADLLPDLASGQVQQGLDLHVRQAGLERFVASGLLLHLRSNVVLLVGDEASGDPEVERLEIVSGLEAGVGQTLLRVLWLRHHD